MSKSAASYRVIVLQCGEDLASDIPFEAADDLAPGRSFSSAAVEVSLGVAIVAKPGQNDAIQGRIGLAVASAVQPVPVGLAGRGGYGIHPAECSKRITLQHKFSLPRKAGPALSPSKLGQLNYPKIQHQVDTLQRAKPGPRTKKAKSATDPNHLKAAKTEAKPTHEQPKSKRIPLSQEEKRARQSATEKVKRQKAKELGLCRHCGETAIEGPTRCDTCAEKHRVARRAHDKLRRTATRHKQDSVEAAPLPSPIRTHLGQPTTNSAVQPLGPANHRQEYDRPRRQSPPKRVEGRTFQFSFPLPGNNSTRKKSSDKNLATHGKKGKKTAVPTPTRNSSKPSNGTSQSRPELTSGPSTSPSRKEYGNLRRQRPDRQKAQRKAAQDTRQRAKRLGLCRDYRDQAIPGQTRCETCAEKHRLARRKNDAERSARKLAERQLTNQE